MLITLAFATILLNLAAPAGAFLLNDTKASTAVNHFAGELRFARSHAVKHGHHVSVCKSLDPQHCDNTGQWRDGWIIFVDLNRDRTRDPGEPILRSSSLDTPSLSPEYSTFPTDNYMVYYPTGRSLGNGTFTFCDTSGISAPRALVLYKTGRLRADSQMPDGSALSCS